MTDYDKLKAELGDVLLKAQGIDQLSDDKKIEQAADGADKNDPAGGATQDGAAGKGGDAPPSDEFVKSFRVKLEDGTETDAYDGTEMMKAMHTLITAQDAALKALTARFDGFAGATADLAPILKALTDASGKHGEMINSLREQPGGRQSTLQAPAKQDPAQQMPTGGDLMAKSLSAAKEGRIGWNDVARIEARLNDRLPIPDDLLAAVNKA
ncbi:hypothetical protein EOD42_22485 [Rhodovarius crocodyli]|uniref:Uncharacterized protein n=1 Tax=Rhodovarius crocodyli TaxID=1979269 RepID=A0A437M1G2_9PROT|nr:hypothetical protein [Rhodovarius crocodyli]RVT91426.1 hypothetical protein EOD42_22485 [Rhodovarius crocodyli]